MIIREIQKRDNEQIAQVIRTVFIDDNFPKNRNGVCRCATRFYV